MGNISEKEEANVLAHQSFCIYPILPMEGIAKQAEV